MSKTKETIALEDALQKKCVEFRTFGCPEVTIGWYGRKRVDFMQTNTRGIIWCYEIKVTKSDFHSKHGHNFYGNFNYYVMPESLYEEVKDEIPPDIGVLVGVALDCKKRAKKKMLTMTDSNNMKMYLIRSLSRESKKNWRSKQVEELMKVEREADYWRNKSNYWRKKYVQKLKRR